MPFDPDAYLAASPAPAPQPAAGGFDPDAYLAQPVGAGTAAVMGAANSATAGFNDEIGGVIGALGEKLGIGVDGSGMLPTIGRMPEIVRAQTREGVQIPNAAADAQDAQTFGDRYRANRDEIRSIDAQAREDHPLAYHGAGIAAAIANPVGAASKGAGMAERIGTAAGVGALAGAGNSTADVTEGNLGGSVWDAVAGGATGAIVGTVAEGAGALARNVVGGAPARQAARDVDALLEKTPAVKVQDKDLAILGGKEGMSKVLKSEDLNQYVRNAKDGLAVASEKLDDVGSDIGSIYAKVDEAQPQGVAARSEVYDRLNALLDGYAQKDQVAKFSALKGMISKLESMDEHLAGPEASDAAREAGAKLPDRTMSAQGIFELKKQLNDLGYTGVGGDIPPLAAKQAARDAGEIIRDFLAERVDGATGQAKKLDELNQKWRNLNAVRDVFQAKATRDERMAPSMGDRLKSFATTTSAAVGVPAGIAAMASGHPVGGLMLAAPGIAALAPSAARGMDSLLISLSNAAQRTGAVPAELIRRAVQIGIPEETATAVVRAAQGGGGPDQAGAYQLPAAPSYQ